MKPKRLILILGPFACILFFVLFVRTFFTDAPQPYRKGDHFRFGALRAGEEIIVTRLFSHRTTEAREYRFRGDQVIVFAADVEWQHGRPVIQAKDILVARSLSRAESDGLNATVEFFRRRRVDASSARREFSIRYLRH